jgi:cystathionine beta-lyase
LGYVACRAAFEEGEEWRMALIDYLRNNRDFLELFLAERLPMLSMSHVEATYLAWIDTQWLERRSEVSFFEKAGVQLSHGAAFGGEGFMRLNFGCPRGRLRAALERILQAVENTDEPSSLPP